MYTLTIYRDNLPTLKIERASHRAAIDAWLRDWAKQWHRPHRFTIADPEGQILDAGTEKGVHSHVTASPKYW